MATESKRILIILHGDRSPQHELSNWAAGADIVIAADGGADFALAAGIVPDFVVGDFDGVSETTLRRFDAVKLRKSDDQYSTDCQKSLGLAIELGASRIVAFGAEGTRLDHTLSAMLSALAVANYGPVTLVFSELLAHLAPVGRHRFKSQPGLLVSANPFGGAIVSTFGLRWELEEVELGPGKRDFTSNVSLGDEFEISVHAGALVVFVGRFEGDIAW